MKVCKECGVSFEPSNKKGVFCSPKCRQKDYRKSVAEKLVQLKDLTKPTNEIKPQEPNKTNFAVDTTNDEIWAKIKAIQAEKIPDLRNTLWGRKSWNAEQKQRIAELEKRLYGK